MKTKSATTIKLAKTPFLAITVFTASLVVGVLLILFGEYPHFASSTLAIFLLIGFTIYNWGIISVPVYSSVLLSYPALVPAITTYVYQIEHYTPLGVQFESVSTANYAVFLVSILLIMKVSTMLFLSSKKETHLLHYKGRKSFLKKSLNYSFRVNFVGFATLCVLALASSYLLAPGATIFEISYRNQTSEMWSWAVFAGAVYKGSWCLMFTLTSDKSCWSRYYWGFVTTSLLSFGWLILHGRRGASFGLIVLLIADIYWNRTNITLSQMFTDFKGFLYFSASFAFLCSMFIIGRFRMVLASLDQGMGIEQLFLKGFSSLSYGNGFAGVPGGGHGVYGTLQATVYLFSHEREFLYGETFLNYIWLSLPTGMMKLLPINKPVRYKAMLGAAYNWNGGNYILNPYFANFGILGVLFGGFMIGVLAYFAWLYLESSNPSPNFTTLISAVIFTNMITSYWYGQLNWIDTFQGALASLIVYTIVLAIATDK